MPPWQQSSCIQQNVTKSGEERGTLAPARLGTAPSNCDWVHRVSILGLARALPALAYLLHVPVQQQAYRTLCRLGASVQSG